MRANLGAFFQHADRYLFAFFGGHLLEANGSRQTGRATADNHHIIFHALALFRRQRPALACIHLIDP